MDGVVGGSPWHASTTDFCILPHGAAGHRSADRRLRRFAWLGVISLVALVAYLWVSWRLLDASDEARPVFVLTGWGVLRDTIRLHGRAQVIFQAAVAALGAAIVTATATRGFRAGRVWGRRAVGRRHRRSAGGGPAGSGRGRCRRQRSRVVGRDADRHAHRARPAGAARTWRASLAWTAARATRQLGFRYRSPPCRRRRSRWFAPRREQWPTAWSAFRRRRRRVGRGGCCRADHCRCRRRDGWSADGSPGGSRWPLDPRPDCGGSGM